MEVPKRIKEAIMQCAQYNYTANLYEKKIHEWLEKNKLTEETAEDIDKNMDDTFIDCCIMGYNPEGFIKTLEELLKESD